MRCDAGVHDRWEEDGWYIDVEAMRALADRCTRAL